jgi:hypothetical protein
LITRPPMGPLQPRHDPFLFLFNGNGTLDF